MTSIGKENRSSQCLSYKEHTERDQMDTKQQQKHEMKMYGIQLCTTKEKATILSHEQLFCPFVSSLVSFAPLCLTHVRKACTNDTNIKAQKE